MKFLCLHGYGTNSLLLEHQLGNIRAALGDKHEYIFLDGELEVEASALAGAIPGIPGPFQGYYTNTSPEQQQKAHDLITNTIAEEGGQFDAIIGFSQGAALGMSYLIHQQIIHPDVPCPFRFALFFTCGFSVSPDPEYQLAEINDTLSFLTPSNLHLLHQGLLLKDGSSLSHLNDMLSSLDPEKRKAALARLSVVTAAMSTRQILHIQDKDEFYDLVKYDPNEARLENMPRIYHEAYTRERVNIPTVHVCGRNDAEPFQELVRVAKGLCSRSKVIFVEHDGRHEIPWKPKDVKAVVSAFEKVHEISLL